MPGRISTVLRRLESLRRSMARGPPAGSSSSWRRWEDPGLARASEVRRLHEILCFLRAYPDSPAVLAGVERILSAFGRRRDLRRHRAALADTGIAGTEIRFRFFAPMAAWLARRWPDRLRVDWGKLSRTDRIRDLPAAPGPLRRDAGAGRVRPGIAGVAAAPEGRQGNRRRLSHPADRGPEGGFLPPGGALRFTLDVPRWLLRPKGNAVAHPGAAPSFSGGLRPDGTLAPPPPLPEEALRPPLALRAAGPRERRHSSTWRGRRWSPASGTWMSSPTPAPGRAAGGYGGRGSSSPAWSAAGKAPSCWSRSTAS